MSYVVINAITVPAERSDELASRFAGRAGMVDKADGFERFELLRPADGRDRWLVVTTWRDEASFQGWMSSQAFGAAHGAGDRPAGDHGAASHDAHAHPTGAHPAGAHPHDHPSHRDGPVSTASEIWAFTVEQHAGR